MISNKYIQYLNNSLNEFILEHGYYTGDKFEKDISLEEYLAAVREDERIDTGLERGMPIRFYKDKSIFRQSELRTKITKLTEKDQLPNGSLLHVLDNFSRPLINPLNPIESKGKFTSFDTPDIEGNIWIRQEQNRKYIYNILDVELDGPCKIDDKYVFLRSGQMKNFMKFRSIYGTTIRNVSGIETIPKLPMSMTIVNHNTLFRMYLRGSLINFRKMNIILSSILNTTTKIQDKDQYILIPLQYEPYIPEVFTRSKDKLTMGTIRYPNRNQYIFFVHLFNFLNPSASASLFNDYPKDKWDKVSFILQSNDFATVFKMSDLITLCNNATAYRKFAFLTTDLIKSGKENELVNISLTTVEKEENLAKEQLSDKEEEELIQKAEKEVVVKEPKEDAGELLVSKLSDQLKRSQATPTTKITAKDATAVLNKLQEEPSDLDISDYSLIEFDEEVFNEELEELAVDEVPVITGSLEDVQKNILRVDDNEYPVGSSFSATTAFKTKEDVSNYGKDFITELDSKAITAIEENNDLTPKMKERYKLMAQQYKTVKLNGKTLEEIITKPVDPTLDKNLTTEVLADQLTDKSMVKSSISQIDQVYVERYLTKDIATVLSTFNTNGMFLVDLETKPKVTNVSKTIQFKAKYKDVRDKSHTMTFELPIIDKDGRCLVNGTEYYFKKQFVALPICKTSPTTVSIASNYNKTVLERNVAKAHNLLDYFNTTISNCNKFYGKDVVAVTFKIIDCKEDAPYEYLRLASMYQSVLFQNVAGYGKVKLHFEYKSRLNLNQYTNTPTADKVKRFEEEFTKLESTYGTLFGYQMTTDRVWFFIDKFNIVSIVTLDKTNKVFDVKKTCLLDLVHEFYPDFATNDKAPTLTEWCDLQILDAKLPVGMILGYKLGIRKLMDELKLPYTLVPRRTRIKGMKKSDAILHFSDVSLIYPRYPLHKSLILSGFRYFDTKMFTFEDLDNPDAYHTLLSLKGISTNYLKGIDSIYELFVDPITREVLLQMNEPTTFKGLLYRATEMVSTDFCKNPSSMANHRVRSYERLVTVLYGEMSRQYASYMHKTGAGNSFSIEPTSVLRKIMQDQAMMNIEDINPVEDLKCTTGITYAGAGGRSSESFVAKDRRFADDAVGIVSEASVDNKSVGLVAFTSMDPKIVTARGLIEPYTLDEVEPTNMLSATSMLITGATNDDCLQSYFTVM